ncbi:MAG: TlpA disulfide reductase family protein [Cyclobacteriaceae bacterium]
MKYFIVSILLSLLFLPGYRQAQDSPTTETEIFDTTRTGTLRSNLVLLDLSGNQIKPDSGKVLILNLWATWCKPCIAEMPYLVNMQAALSDDFQLLLASDEGMEKIKKFTKNRPFDLQFAGIQNSIESMGVYSLPTTLVIGKNGDLLETLVGARKWDSPEQINLLNSYLK